MPGSGSSYLGQLAGIAAALTWAVGSLIFSRIPLPAAALNFLKSSIAALFLGVTVAITSAVQGAWPTVSREAWGYLVASALVGIFLGDTAYYRSLQILGPRRALVLTTTTPLAGALLGWVFLRESLCWHGWLGVGVTLSGVASVLVDRGAVSEAPGHFPGRPAVGVAYGLAGAACQAGGFVLSKQAMQSLPPLETAFLRLVIAAILAGATAAATRRIGTWMRSVRAGGLLPRVTAGTLCGTYLGIWLSLVANLHTRIAVATTLTSLTPIFILPLAWIAIGQRITARGALGAAIAVCGVALLFCDCNGG